VLGIIPPVATRILALKEGQTELTTATPEELPALLGNDKNLVWVDMWDPGEAEKKILETTFELHPVLIDDMLADAPTPKVERFENYVYVVFHALLEGAEKKGAVELVDFDFFLGKNWLVSSRPKDATAAEQTFNQIKKKPAELRKGVAYVAYLMVEHITERFLPLMDHLDRDIDRLESEILHATGPHLLENVFSMKKKLQRLRRVGLHQKEILNRLGRGDFEQVPEETRPFFRDAYDHFVRVVDLGDSFSDIVNGAMEAYISINGHKMNEVMKVLTLSSTMMLPLTFIAGLYGMNFEVMPELHWRYGYYFALGAMGLTAVGLVGYFKRRGWL
jgi:magnesium transporter